MNSLSPFIDKQCFTAKIWKILFILPLADILFVYSWKLMLIKLLRTICVSFQCEPTILIGYWNSLSDNASPRRLDSISHHIQTCLPNKKSLDSLPRWLHQFAFSALLSRYSECYTLSSVSECLIYLSSASRVVIFVCISIFLVTDVNIWWCVLNIFAIFMSSLVTVCSNLLSMFIDLIVMFYRWVLYFTDKDLYVCSDCTLV